MALGPSVGQGKGNTMPIAMSIVLAVVVAAMALFSSQIPDSIRYLFWLLAFAIIILAMGILEIKGRV
jgi:hypothetical protein